jgi:hypothetical protein
MQAQASGAQQAQPDWKLQSRPTAIPAISKSTELQPQGQPSFVFGQLFSSSQDDTPRRHRTTPQDDTVISTEAAHAFVSRAMEKSASLPRLPPEPSPRLHLLPFLVLIPPRKSAFPFPNLSPHKPPDPNPAPHPSQFIIYPLTPIHPRSTLCAYSTHWHL